MNDSELRELKRDLDQKFRDLKNSNFESVENVFPREYASHNPEDGDYFCYGARLLRKLDSIESKLQEINIHTIRVREKPKKMIPILLGLIFLVLLFK